MCARRSRSYLASATVFFFATLHPAVPNNAIALICRSAKHLASPLPRFAPLCLCTSLCCAAMLLLCCDSPVAGLPPRCFSEPGSAIAVLSLQFPCCSYQNLASAASRFALPCLCEALNCSTMPLPDRAQLCLCYALIGPASPRLCAAPRRNPTPGLATALPCLAQLRLAPRSRCCAYHGHD